VTKTKFTLEEAIDVWMRHFSGQYQHQIAAAYVINVLAVNHVLKGRTHVGSKQLAEARFNKSAQSTRRAALCSPFGLIAPVSLPPAICWGLFLRLLQGMLSLLPPPML
jgi:hypothetical protein